MMDHSCGSIYDPEVPSLTASMEAFNPERSMHSTYSGRSNMHSSRWSIPQDEPESEAESDGPWAPPAWQQPGSKYMRKSQLGESGMRSSRSPFERDVTPSHIPLPESPMKQTPRTSPEPMSEQEHTYMPGNIASRMQSPSEEPHMGAGAHQRDDMAMSRFEGPGQNDGCTLTRGMRPYRVLTSAVVRFTIRGETLFHTGPLEETVTTFARGAQFFTHSKRNTISAFAILFISWLLVQPWTASLIPDVANVANMAKQFEPLMYASENVIPRSRELAEASIAVQDLGESVRATNMSASTVIIDQLDDLGDSLKTLSEKITSFFTNVDGDMDS
jgi:hypothetical protein